MLTIKIIPNDTNNPPGKLADAELHFESITVLSDRNGQLTPAQEQAKTLAGLKLIGFSIWERRTGGRNVTFPARSYSINGERRSFALLRPIADQTAQDRIRDLVLAAYKEYEDGCQTEGSDPTTFHAGDYVRDVSFAAKGGA